MYVSSFFLLFHFFGYSIAGYLRIYRMSGYLFSFKNHLRVDRQGSQQADFYTVNKEFIPMTFKCYFWNSFHCQFRFPLRRRLQHLFVQVQGLSTLGELRERRSQLAITMQNVCNSYTHFSVQRSSSPYVILSGVKFLQHELPVSCTVGRRTVLCHTGWKSMV